MLTIKQLLALTNSEHPKVVTNSGHVGVGWSKQFTEGKDARGYYWVVRGTALSSKKAHAGRRLKPGVTNAPRQKRWEIRFYYPKAKSKEDQYIPKQFRQSGKYFGPTNPPETTLSTNVWVFCNCEYFLFACELADAERDASSLNPDGSYYRRALNATDSSGAQITKNNGKGYSGRGPNKSGNPRLCKHLIAAIKKGALTKGPI